MPSIEPSVVYLALVLGLWLGVTAIYMPGTGVLELLAGLALVGCFLLLTSMPTNWIAVLLLVIGVLSFIVMPFLKQQFVLLAIGGLVLQGAGGLLMFDGFLVSPLVVATTIVIALLYHRFALIPILEKAQQPIISEDDLLLGAHGRVVRALDPTGTVNVNGELWTATSDHTLKPGDEIVVVERTGLQVYVEAVKQKRSGQNNHKE